MARMALEAKSMKLKLLRTLIPPTNKQGLPVRIKNFAPWRLRTFRLIEKGGKNMEDVQDENQYMTSQLCDDITSDYSIQMTAKAIEEVASGRIPTWEGTGNAWTVVLRPDGATFEFSIMDGEPGGKVSLETYRRALEAWRDFLADESCDERIVELPD